MAMKCTLIIAVLTIQKAIYSKRELLISISVFSPDGFLIAAK
jgi:hypothetical protein